jgi:hypothetical protein
MEVASSILKSFRVGVGPFIMAVWILREMAVFEIDRVSGTALAAGLKLVDYHHEKPAVSALPLKYLEVPDNLATHTRVSRCEGSPQLLTNAGDCGTVQWSRHSYPRAAKGT